MADPPGSQRAIDVYARSAFGATRSVQPFTLADIINRYDVDPDWWGTDTSVNGTVEHEAATSSIGLTVTADSGSEAFPVSMDVGCTADGTVRVYVNPDAITGGDWNSHDDVSGIETNVNATGMTLGDAELVAQFYVDNVNPRTYDLSGVFKRGARFLERRYPTGQDELLVTLDKRTGGNATFYVTLTWREVR